MIFDYSTVLVMIEQEINDLRNHLLNGGFLHVYDNYNFETKILAASIRHTMHVIDCAKVGADVMTGPLSSIVGLLKHPLTDSGLSKFLEDYKKGN